MLNLIKDSLPKITVLKQYGKIFINKNKKYKKILKKYCIIIS
jgi:predicted glycosyltransferase